MGWIRLKKASEEKFFEWFYFNCDFGPSDSDYRDRKVKEFEEATGLKAPDGFGEEWENAE